MYDTALVAIDGDTEAPENRIESYEAEEGEKLDAEERREIDDYVGGVAVRAIDGALSIERALQAHRRYSPGDALKMG